MDDFDLDDDLPPEYTQVMTNVDRTAAKSLNTKEIKINDESDDGS